MLVALLALAAPISLPPAKIGQCGWVHGRYAVYNGSNVRRIWVIGTDDDEDVPPAISSYRQDPAGGALFGDFYVCAREPSRHGRMQHVRLRRARNLTLEGKPFSAK